MIVASQWRHPQEWKTNIPSSPSVASRITKVKVLGVSDPQIVHFCNSHFRYQFVGRFENWRFCLWSYLMREMPKKGNAEVMFCLTWWRRLFLVHPKNGNAEMMFCWNDDADLFLVHPKNGNACSEKCCFSLVFGHFATLLYFSRNWMYNGSIKDVRLWPFHGFCSLKGFSEHSMNPSKQALGPFLKVSIHSGISRYCLKRAWSLFEFFMYKNQHEISLQIPKCKEALNKAYQMVTESFILNSLNLHFSFTVKFPFLNAFSMLVCGFVDIL